MVTKTRQNSQHTFFCECCNYKCSKKSDFEKHKMTAKHKMVTNGYTKLAKLFQCECGKTYKHRQGLHRHKQRCTIIDRNQYENKEVNGQIMLLLEAQQKERDEHKKEIQKLSEQITKMSTITNNTTNNNNNKFNLNFFLNTQCKDAMSIQSFMENLQLGCKELEHMGHVGYLNGMIDIFNNTIGNMDVYKRPLHCTDLKREVLYFKQGMDWERDSEDKQHLKKLIKNVEIKNYYNLQDWQKDHPGSLQCDTPDSEHYMKIATEALGGADSNKDSMYLSKIMKHIIKEVHIKP
jgi:hypothetical protein